MKSDIKQIVILVISFVAGITAFALTHLYMRGRLNDLERRRLEIEAGLEKVKVIVAARTLPAGTILQKTDVAMKSVPSDGLSGEPVKPEEFDLVEGRQLKLTVEEHKPILWFSVDSPYAPGAGLSPMIRKRLRAIAISVGGSSAVSGHVSPNDRVDVLGTFAFPSRTAAGEMEILTMTILQNVTVLATGRETAKSGSGGYGMDARAGGYSTVTLEVSPKEAELLVFAEYMKGRLSLSLRNPDDMDFLEDKDLGSVDFNHLQTKIPEYNDVRQRTIINRRR